MNDNAIFKELLAAVRGGRVASTGFLMPDDAAGLAAKLREADAGVHVSGGYPGAKRRVVTAFPEHIPEAHEPLAAVYYAGVHDEHVLRAALERHGLSRDALGDALVHQDGLSLVVLASSKDQALSLQAVEGRPISPQAVDLKRISSGKTRSLTVIVPALRVDTLGAKAFRVSRSYFSKGIAGGKVSVNGRQAGKSSTAEPGDEVYAAGLGRFTVARVQGETRKGNLKVEVEVEVG
jgi:RNA-binding protein YlmH